MCCDQHSRSAEPSPHFGPTPLSKLEWPDHVATTCPQQPWAVGATGVRGDMPCQQVPYFKIKVKTKNPTQNLQQQKLFPAVCFEQLPLWDLFSALSLACPTLLFFAQGRHNNGLGTCRSSCTSAFARGKNVEVFTSAQEHLGTRRTIQIGIQPRSTDLQQIH